MKSFPAIGFEGKTHLVFAVFGLVLGLLYLLLLPPLQAPDEFAHFYRAYGISEGYFVAPDFTPVPRSVNRFAQQFPPHAEDLAPLHAGNIRALLLAPLNQGETVNVRNEAMDIYVFFPYLPSAAAIAFGRVLHLPALALFYVARLTNLAAFLAAVVLALRWLPDFHTSLLALALLPTALLQAASASWDGGCFAAAFLFTAYILRLAFGKSEGPLRRKEYAILAGLVALNALLKMNVCLTLLILIIPSSRFGSRGRKILTLAGAFAIIGIEIVGWRTVASRDFQAYSLSRAATGINLARNLNLIEVHPNLFAEAVLRSCRFLWFHWADNFVATIGWLAASIPAWIVWSYMGVLVLTAVSQTRSVRIVVSQRVVLVLTLAAGSIAVFAALLYAETPANYLPAITDGQGFVPLIQGRYFIPLALAGCVAVSSRRMSIPKKWFAPALLAVIIVANVSALSALASTYYWPPLGDGCASCSFESKLVRRPGDSFEDGKVYIVVDHVKHWVKHAEWLQYHGYRWPADVRMISAEKLNSIPTGAPIEDPK